MNNKPSIRTELSRLMGTNTVSQVFDFIEQAEEQVSWAMKEYPDKAELIYNMFLPLGEYSQSFMDFTPRLFGSFCHDILNRIGRGAKKDELQAGTMAECLLSISRASDRAPLNQDGFVMYFRLYREVFGTYPEMIPDEELRHSLQETWKGSVDTEIAMLQRKIAGLRTIHVPTEKELEDRRRQDIKEGNTPLWMQYQPVKSFQMSLV